MVGFEWTDTPRWFRDKSQNKVHMLFCLTTAVKGGIRILAFTSGKLHIGLGWKI